MAARRVGVNKAPLVPYYSGLADYYLDGNLPRRKKLVVDHSYGRILIFDQIEPHPRLVAN